MSYSLVSVNHDVKTLADAQIDRVGRVGMDWDEVSSDDGHGVADDGDGEGVVDGGVDESEPVAFPRREDDLGVAAAGAAEGG